MFKPGIIVIAGPTGVGKSDFATEFALRCDGEIINGDLGQFYTPLTIGTAKPNLTQEAVPHHQFNIFDEPINYTVKNYRSDLKKTVHEIWQRKKTPIIVGGSTFYISSIYFPPLNFGSVELDERQKALVYNARWKDLYEIDPQRATEIDPSDIYRIRRAVALWYQTGKKPSALKPVFNPLAPSLFVLLTRKRQELNMRIDERVVVMLNQGWIDECRALKGTEWEPFVREKGFIGYREIFDYLDGPQQPSDFEELIKDIAQKTRNYAKRQMTFWRMLQKKLERVLPARGKVFCLSKIP